MAATLVNIWYPSFWTKRESVTVSYENGSPQPYEITAWLQSDAASGDYTRAFRDHLDHTTLTVYFSDPDTAFAFKMRFR